MTRMCFESLYLRGTEARRTTVREAEGSNPHFSPSRQLDGLWTVYIVISSLSCC